MTKKPTNDPRGGKEELNTPEPSSAPITPPSQKRPFNPSDEIEHQIEASDAKTKKPGEEFEKMNDEQVKDYAVKVGVDGNDGLSREEIIGKIQAFQGKRMFPDEKGNMEVTAKDQKAAQKGIEDLSKTSDTK